VNANLQQLREAITTAMEDRDEMLRFFRPVIRGTYQKHLWDQFARLEGDIHELDLLRKRELSLLVDGREPVNFTGDNGENGDRKQQGSEPPFPPFSPVQNLEVSP